MTDKNASMPTSDAIFVVNHLKLKLSRPSESENWPVINIALSTRYL